MREYRLLLVDDDPYILTGIGKDLESESYAITTASNGEKAVQLLASATFDLVITDLVMERIDGIQVLKAAKSLSAEIMVMILTGYGDISSAIDALRQDADDYLLKPCDPEEIRFRVAKCLERQEQLRKIKIYEKMLPICCVCKKIRDDSGKAPGQGAWVTIEKYFWDKARISPTSTYCPTCAQRAKQELELI
jgi:DNA-binding NtrC family response regulator